MKRDQNICRSESAIGNEKRMKKRKITCPTVGLASTAAMKSSRELPPNFVFQSLSPIKKFLKLLAARGTCASKRATFLNSPKGQSREPPPMSGRRTGDKHDPSPLRYLCSVIRVKLPCSCSCRIRSFRRESSGSDRTCGQQ